MSVKSNVKTTIGTAVVNIDAENAQYLGKLGQGRINVLSAVK
jgi:hypothetical protein